MNPSNPTNTHNADDTATQRLRSRRWFDDQSNPGMTALYLERYMNYGITREELQSGKPIISNWQPAFATASAMQAASRSNSPFTPSRKPASALPPRLIATSLILASLKSCTAIRSTAWSSPPAAIKPRPLA
jgi:hypothetical protein